MKGTVAVVLLIIVCAALGTALILGYKKASDQQKDADAEIEMLRRDLQDAQAKLSEQRTVNDTLVSTLDTRAEELSVLSNSLDTVAASLEETEAKAAAAADTAKQAQQTAAEREAQINQLSGQNDQLTREMADLTSVLGELESQITETERKLAASEGDREYLLRELRDLQEEKAELERQMTDLSALREQIRKLKDELSIARRLEWIRRGLYGGTQRGAEKLEPGFAEPAGPGYDLTVEIRQDGEARVVGATNNPAPQ